MRLGQLTDAERLHFGASRGIVVRDVWQGSIAARSGLRPGDILIAINAEPIGSVDQLTPLVGGSDAEAFDVAVRRGSGPGQPCPADQRRGGR